MPFTKLTGYLYFFQRVDGIASIDIDKSYVRQHGYSSTLDQLIVKIVSNPERQGSEALDPLSRLLVSVFCHRLCIVVNRSSKHSQAENPSEAEKFSAIAYNILGDYAIGE